MAEAMAKAKLSILYLCSSGQIRPSQHTETRLKRLKRKENAAATAPKTSLRCSILAFCFGDKVICEGRKLPLKRGDDERDGGEGDENVGAVLHLEEVKPTTRGTKVVELAHIFINA